MKIIARHLLLLFASIVLITVNACKDDDDPTPENEEELITTLMITLIPQGGGAGASFLFRDLDGDGGNAPVITSEKLAASTIYTAALTLLNEQETPATDITTEVKSEDEEHQFFYLIDDNLNLTFTYGDTDSDGNPLGLLTTFTTGEPSNGNLTVVLRHDPDKNAVGVKAGDITNAGGETDIEIDFPVSIE